jgi:hypothetical protein
MKMRLEFRIAAAFLVLTLFAVLPVHADGPQSLSIRMVLAGQGSDIDPQLQDVAALMKGNLAFSSFKLLEARTVPLPAASPLVFSGNYKVTLLGPADNLDITVTRGRQAVIKTLVKLNGRPPLVLGGVASRDGTILFVLNLVN